MVFTPLSSPICGGQGSLFNLKEGSTSHPYHLSSGAREETALLGAQNRYAIMLAAPSKVFAMIIRYVTVVCWWSVLVRTVLYYKKKLEDNS